jgi:hypothetical protein
MLIALGALSTAIPRRGCTSQGMLAKREQFEPAPYDIRTPEDNACGHCLHPCFLEQILLVIYLVLQEHPYKYFHFQWGEGIPNKIRFFKERGIHKLYQIVEFSRFQTTIVIDQ